MPSIHDPIRGIPLADKPADASRCGMSHASFAQHRTSNRWYELSIEERILGSPLEFDFFRSSVPQGPQAQSREKVQELSQITIT